MTKLLIYLLIFGLMLYLLSTWNPKPNSGSSEKPPAKPKGRFRSKSEPGELWIQVYETALAEEAKALRARLQEEEIDCVIYEQGKKDIHGNAMKGYGVAVPRMAVSHSQSVISRTLS